MHLCKSQIIGSFSSYCRHLKARASPPIPANPPQPCVAPHTCENTSRAKNRTQLALQGLHISHSSQHAPEHFCPSCPIFSSGTRGGSLFFPSRHPYPSPPSPSLNCSSPPWQVSDRPAAQIRSMTTLQRIYYKTDMQ